jgi:hypothetical protein
MSKPISATVPPEEIYAMVSSEDMWWLLLSTVSYGLGRHSYAPSTIAELVIKYHDFLTKERIEQMARKIRDHLHITPYPPAYKDIYETWSALATELEQKKTV